MSSSPATGRGATRAPDGGDAKSATRARFGRETTTTARTPRTTERRSTAPSPDAPSQPRLRLVGTEDRAALKSLPQGQPLTGPTDPRWVLAVRTAEQLEGTLLSPEKRQRLIRLGRVMGLTVFDCNLVVAIVQDQARRGHAADYCPAAAEAQLQMVPVPRYGSWLARLRQRPWLFAGCIVVTLIAIELALLRWLF